MSPIPPENAPPAAPNCPAPAPPRSTCAGRPRAPAGTAGPVVDDWTRRLATTAANAVVARDLAIEASPRCAPSPLLS